MKYINKHFENTLEIKQSKFITHFVPYLLYDETIQKLKQEHPKARHFVVAYRYLNEYNQVVEYCTDDGEPKGTSGKPSLIVLQGSDMINIAVIVVRYFGGTKLGTGGLVRAYSDAVNLVLDKADLIEFKQEVSKQLRFEYSDIRRVEYECEKLDIKIVKKEFNTLAIFEVNGAEDDICKLILNLGRVIK